MDPWQGTVPPHELFAYIRLFKACASARDLPRGMSSHSDACRAGLLPTLFVPAENTLISMYGKCGSLHEAKYVFLSMKERTTVSWNAMLSAFVAKGQGNEALKLCRQMLYDRVNLDLATFVVVLQACGLLASGGKPESDSHAMMCVEIGYALHSRIRREQTAQDPFVASALISLYGKCKAIVMAEYVFSSVVEPSAVLWNAMLSAYVESDQGEKALQLYALMREEKVSPDDATYVIALQACTELAEKEGSFDEGRAASMPLRIGHVLHTSSHRQGSTSNVLVNNSLITMYGRCGASADAEHLFYGFSLHSVMSWNAMLSVYIETGQPEKALLLYMQMREDKAMSDQRTFVIILQACIVLVENEENLPLEEKRAKAVCLEIGQALHAEASKQGFACDAFVGSALLSMYAACGSVVGVEYVFGMIKCRDLVTWNAVLSAYVEQGHGETALVTYKEMLLDGEAPNQRTFVILLQACVLMAEKEETLLMNQQLAKVASLAIGQALHMDADKIGFMHDVFVGNSLISMYGKCGSILEAEVVFDRLSQRDVVSWNAIVSAYIDQGQVDKALRLYCRMCKQCITLVTLTRILQACSGSGSLEICRQLHFELVSTAHSDNTPAAPTLISAYGGCASMLDAQACCDEVPEVDIASWNACIAGHAGEGDTILTFHVFETMVLAGVEVDKVTFVSLFSACAHCGLVGEGLEYFVAMNKDYGIVPDMKHYGSILNLLGRAGDFTRVESVLERMPMEADITLWLCLLGACTHGNLELAERAFENAVTLQPTHASPYVLMSNIYADAGVTESYVYSSL